MTMHLHVMARGEHALDQIRMGSDPLTEHEERRAHARVRERVKHRGRAAGVGAVVEGEREQRQCSARIGCVYTRGRINRPIASRTPPSRGRASCPRALVEAERAGVARRVDAQTDAALAHSSKSRGE